jgi:hypothetical protein
MLDAYFYHSPNSQVEHNCARIKWIGLLLVLYLEWLALYLSFSFGVGIQFAQSSSQWEARADT